MSHSLLSKRGQSFLQTPEFVESIVRCFSDPYHEERNPGGYVNLGVAANTLSFDLLQEKLDQLQKDHPVDPSLYGYGDMQGYPPLREQISKLFSKKIFKKEVKSSQFCLGSGATSILETLGACLCDEGEYIMVSTPMYHAFETDFSKRFSTLLLPVQMRHVDGRYEINVEDLEQHLQKAKQENRRVKAFMLCNPHNPSGIIFPKETVSQLLHWCLKNSIHLVSDEIYALSVFDNQKFTSIVEICAEHEEKFPQYQDYVHVVWSFSKDFGLNGFRLGVLFSENTSLIQAVASCAYFMLPSNQSQHHLSLLLQDGHFLEEYIPTNQKRLYEMAQFCMSFFEQNKIKFMKPDGAMFLWFNLLQSIDPNKKWTREDEKRLWNTCMEQRVFISPAFMFQETEPGWFRICFSCVDQATLNLAFKKIQKALVLFKDQ